MTTPVAPHLEGTVLIANGVTIGIARNSADGEDYLMIGPITLMVPINDAARKALVEGLTKVRIAKPGEVNLQ